MPQQMPLFHHDISTRVTTSPTSCWQEAVRQDANQKLLLKQLKPDAAEAETVRDHENTHASHSEARDHHAMGSTVVMVEKGGPAAALQEPIDGDENSEEALAVALALHDEYKINNVT